MIRVSVTELQDYMRCRRAWDYGSPYRQALEKIGKPVAALHLGTAVHHGVAAPIFGDDPETALETWYAEERVKIAEDHIKATGNPLTPADLTALDEQKQLAMGMVRHYFQRYGKNPIDPFEYIAAEMTLEIPLPFTDTKGESVSLVGTIDGVALDEHGRVWVVERKSYSIKPDLKALQLDHQETGYGFMLQACIREPIAGVLYDGLNKKLPKAPKVLKDGSLSVEWNDNVTASSFMEAMYDNGQEMNPKYEAFLKRLRIRDMAGQTPFFTRHRIQLTQNQIERWKNDMFLCIKEIANDPDIYPHRAWSGCWDCWFQDLCDTKTLHGDMEENVIKEVRYRKGDYRPQYKTKARVTPDNVHSVQELRELLMTSA